MRPESVPTRYRGWSMLQLISELWNVYGKAPATDPKGRLCLKERKWPNVPQELMREVSQRSLAWEAIATSEAAVTAECE